MNRTAIIDVSAKRIAMMRPFGVRFQARESSDKPILKAFCRVTPSLRFRLLAIFLAGVFLRAADFNSRSSEAVQERRFEFLLAM